MIKEELTNFEKSIIKILRLKKLNEMNYPGSIVIHFSKDRKTSIVNPASVERKEVMA